MKTKKIIKVALVLFILFAVMACNLPFNLNNQFNNAPGQGGQTTGDSNQEGQLPALFQGTPDPNPVGIQTGLGSFDSYKMTIQVNSHNSKGAKTEISEVIERSLVDKNSHSVMTTTSFDPEKDTEEDTSTQETYNIGNVTCENSGEEWTYDEVTSQDKEMADVFKNMIDIIPIMENPVFVAEETINGVDCNHFTFTVSGIGDTSGSVATVNQGDYWLAKDGQYLVKYHLVLEVQSAAEGTSEAETSNIEGALDLTDINVPLTFTLPETCVPTPAE
jgi:hypothetical protein